MRVVAVVDLLAKATRLFDAKPLVGGDSSFSDCRLCTLALSDRALRNFYQPTNRTNVTNTALPRVGVERPNGSYVARTT